MSSVASRSAVLVPVVEAAPAVNGWREQTCNDKPSIGVPPHITLIFPFVPARQLDGAVVSSLTAIIGGRSSFEFELRDIARFPTCLYLVPDPAEPFIQLTEAIVERFPEHPPFEGAFDPVVPHLTVAHGDERLLDAVESDVARHLTIKSVAREALLLEEVEPNWGRWQVRARLPFASTETRKSR
jgi:2'-5' RNA ligase